MDALTVGPVRATDRGVAALIATHFDLMRSSSPEESCHVQPADALEEDDAFFVAAKRGETVLSIGAFKQIGPDHCEIKSMHTHVDARGQGLALHVLRALIVEAKAQGMVRASLETGSDALFTPARRLYQSESFEICAPFCDYVEDPLSVFMTRIL